MVARSVQVHPEGLVEPIVAAEKQKRALEDSTAYSIMVRRYPA